MDANQFAAHYECLYRDLYRFAFCFMGSAADAEDILGESVLVAWEKRDQLRNEDSFKPWLFQITANACRRRLRRAARMRPTQPDQLDPGRSSAELDDAESLAVREAFSSLGEEDRLIVALSVFGGYHSGEIGSMLEMNPSTVRSRRKRALDRMAAQMEGGK